MLQKTKTIQLLMNKKKKMKKERNVKAKSQTEKKSS